MANSLIDSSGKLNVENYNEKVRKQRETFSRIDSTMAILEKLPDFTDSTLDVLNANSFTFSTNPLGFVFNIIKSLGVDEETLKEWIVNILVFVLPVVEIGVKGSLLSNLKQLISCNADPRIPLRLRKKISDSVYTNILTDVNNDGNIRGVDINIDAIDPNGILNLSPFTYPGNLYYFGCTDDSELDSSIKKIVSKYDDGQTIDTKEVVGDGNAKFARLARADDFNAFLWYVVHKGNKQNPAKVTINGSKLKIEDDDLEYDIVSGNLGLLGTMEVKTPEGKESNIIAGNTFYDANNANYIGVCIESKIDKESGKITGNTIVPISSDWFSCNWYVDKTNYYGSNLGIKKSKPRNYSEEKTICNLRYCNQSDYKSGTEPKYPHNIRFSILPKPYVLLPSLDEEKSNDGKVDKLYVQWRPIRLMFDADGTPNQKGKFSLISETYDLQPTLRNKQVDGELTYYDVYGIEENGAHTSGAKLVVNRKTGKYVLKDLGENASKILVECYPGLTVYEFNYDYIMGMKLFDPKVVCQKLFDNAANPKFDASFTLTLNDLKNKEKYPYITGKLKVIEIVKEILAEDDGEITDCFFNFSNKQYDEMLQKTEEIRYRQLPYNQGYNGGISVDFSEVNKILETFPVNGSQEEQKKVLSNALTKACIILDNCLPSDGNTGKIDFLTKLLQQLVAAIIDSILSPKVLMLLVVNEALMDTQVDEPFSTEVLMKIANSVIVALVKEVRDLIIKKLLDYIIEHLTPLALQIQEKVASEQFAAYMSIIRLLMEWFDKGAEVAGRLNSVLLSMLNREHDIDLPSILDNFTYADIYSSNTKDNTPLNKNC